MTHDVRNAALAGTAVETDLPPDVDQLRAAAIIMNANIKGMAFRLTLLLLPEGHQGLGSGSFS